MNSIDSVAGADRPMEPMSLGDVHLGRGVSCSAHRRARPRGARVRRGPAGEARADHGWGPVCGPCPQERGAPESRTGAPRRGRRRFSHDRSGRSRGDVSRRRGGRRRNHRGTGMSSRACGPGAEAESRIVAAHLACRGGSTRLPHRPLTVVSRASDQSRSRNAAGFGVCERARAGSPESPLPASPQRRGAASPMRRLGAGQNLAMPLTFHPAPRHTAGPSLTTTCRSVMAVQRPFFHCATMRRPENVAVSPQESRA